MRQINLANWISLSRMFFVLPIVVLLYFPGPITCFFAALMFGAASATDYLDGMIARRWNLVSTVGKFLDPLADKVLICSILVMLVERGWVSAWIVLLILCRELAVTGLRAVAADEGIIIAADRGGKLKTVFQISAIIPLLLHYPLLGLPLHEIGLILLYAALALTLSSGFNYFRRFFMTLNERHCS